MSTLRHALSALALSALAGAAGAQLHPYVSEFLREGELVNGVGLITRIDNLTVNEVGEILVEVDTDNPDTDADGVLLRQGVYWLQEGALLAEPLGSAVGSFDALSLDADGDIGWNLFLDGLPSGQDSGVYWNHELLVQEGDVSGAAGFSPGTPYLGFFEVKLGGADELLVLASVDDPAVASGVDRALVLLTTDGAGNLTGETVVAKEGDVLPGQTEAVADFQTGPHDLDLNAAGQVAFLADLTGDTGRDGVAYVDGTLVAQEGEPSPVVGRTWGDLASGVIALSDAGHWALRGRLAGDPSSDTLLVVDGQKLAQEGDVLPGTGGHPLTGMGSGPVCLGDGGNVLWYGDWADPDTDADSGLFLNDTLIVQEGEPYGAGTLDVVRGVQDGAAMGADGRWLVFEGELSDGSDVVFRMLVGRWTYLGQGLAGFGGEIPRLFGGGTLDGGIPFQLELVDARPLATTNLVIGAAELGAPFKGGIMVPAVDVLAAGLPVDADGRLSITLTLPLGVPAGVPLWFQYWTADADGPAGFSASTALRALTP